MQTIIVILFCLVMAANVVALLRHWQMMRVMTIALNGLTETQNAFNELMEEERRRQETEQRP